MPPKLSRSEQQKSSAALARPKNTLHTGLSRTSGAPSTPENTRNKNTINNHNILEYPSKYRSKLPKIFTTTHINGRPLSINNNIHNIIEDNGGTILTYTIDYNLKKLNSMSKKEFMYYGFTINDILIKTSIQTFKDDIEFYGSLNYDTLQMTPIKKQKINNKQQFKISVNDFKVLFKNFVLYQILNYSKLLTGSGTTLNSIRSGTQGLNDLQLINIIKYIYEHINFFIPKSIASSNTLKQIYFVTVFLKNILIQIKPYSEIMRYIENRIKNTTIEGVTTHQSRTLQNEQIKLSTTFLDIIYQERIYNKEQLDNFKRIHRVRHDTILDNVFNDLLLFKEVLDYIYHISNRLIKYKDIYSSTPRGDKKQIIDKINKYARIMINTITSYCNDPDNPEYDTHKCIYYRGYNYQAPVEEEEVNNEEAEDEEYEEEERVNLGPHEAEELPFIRCYRIIERLSNNFTNFDFLNRPDIFEDPIYNNIMCIYNAEYFAHYCAESEAVDYQPVSKNIFKCMPYVLFYYYKAIVNAQEGADAGGGAGAGGALMERGDRGARARDAIEKYLNICLNVLRVYKYLIEHIGTTLIVNGNATFNINNVKEYVYKINKILYKTLKQFYQYNQYKIIDFMYIIREINDLRRELIRIYPNSGIPVTENLIRGNLTHRNSQNNYYNYIHGLIPNYNERIKEQVYGAIQREDELVREVIQQELPHMGNTQARLASKYNMLRKRERPFVIEDPFNDLFGAKNTHNDNHIFFRKLFNNEKLGLNHPLKKYYNYYFKRKI